MSAIKTTLITNVFNEEYLLPFWLEHHKNMFDELIIIDYNSTDKSMEICKRIWPECIIRKSRTTYFGVNENDEELMNIENNIQGIKIVLNTTEFLFCEKSINDIFINNIEPASYTIIAVSPYSQHSYNINNSYELFTNLLNDDVVYHHDRGVRHIHNFPNGRYQEGRHGTYNIHTPTMKAYIIWFGFYPMNDDLMKRKLQIQQNMTQHDKDRGAGAQHFFSKDKLLNINNEKSNSGSSLKNISSSLYDLLCKNIKQII